MKRSIIFAAALLAGCANRHPPTLSIWDKQGATEAEYKLDSHACSVESQMLSSQMMMQANTCAATTAPLLRTGCYPAVIQPPNADWEACMLAHSWQVSKVIPLPEASYPGDASMWELARDPDLPLRFQGYTEEDIEAMKSGD